MVKFGLPAHADVGILALVEDEWSHHWQPRHHIVSRMARYFHVVWMEPPASWRTRFRRSGARNAGVPTVPGLHLVRAQDSVPLVHRPAALCRRLQILRWRQGVAHLRRLGCRRIVLYVWRPEFGLALDTVPHDLSCYHIDDEYSWSDVDVPLPASELALIRKADRVFIHSPELLHKKGSLNAATVFVPNGVDFAAYSTPHPEPPDLAGIAHPRIGYTGFIKPQLDFELIARLVDAHPEWSFVFVGIERGDEVERATAALRRYPHVHFLGAKSVDELASYPQHFDVCIMPYRITDYTKYIYPMKLHEYLASGCPAVGAYIPSLAEFAEHVALARTFEEWERAITTALEPGMRESVVRSRRQAVAAAHDWSRLAQTVAEHMARDLGIELRLA